MSLIERLRNHAPESSVYGLSRSILALATLTTLLTNSVAVLFPFQPTDCQGAESLSLFCLSAPGGLGVARWASIVCLGVTMVGLYPRFTGILHWWVTHSFLVSCRIADGGDQLAANLALLLIPVTLFDRRTWHWGRASYWTGDDKHRGGHPRTTTTCLIAVSALIALRLQVAMVYLQATMGKLMKQEWRDGTAMYYWLLDPLYGLPGYVRGLGESVLSVGFVVKGLTWTVMAIEFLLFVALFGNERLRRTAFYSGVALHLAIAVFLGLPTFSAVMIAALLLYVPPAAALRPRTGSASWLFPPRPAGTPCFEGPEAVGPRTPTAWKSVY